MQLETCWFFQVIDEPAGFWDLPVSKCAREVSVDSPLGSEPCDGGDLDFDSMSPYDDFLDQCFTYRSAVLAEVLDGEYDVYYVLGRLEEKDDTSFCWHKYCASW